MPPKRKAVQDGNTTTTPRRSLRLQHAATAPVAESSNAAKEAKTMPPSAESPNKRPKRNPRRSAKKDPWDEEHLLTNSESPLVYVDLVKILAHPDAWNCLDEDEKKEILALLPDNIHPNPDPDPEDPNAKIPPLPQQFLRYSNTWREGVRQFQVDLEAGRYDPEWLRQAADAMEERARGEFDDFKEREFEEFWGQKQKLDYRVVAGESSRVKLDALIKHEVIQKGDVWKYTRVFGKSQKIMVEKEVKVVDIIGSTLTFAIPPGQRVFLAASDNSNTSNRESEKEDTSDKEIPMAEDSSKTNLESRSETKLEADQIVDSTSSSTLSSALTTPGMSCTNVSVEIIVPPRETTIATTPTKAADVLNGSVPEPLTEVPVQDLTEPTSLETNGEPSTAPAVLASAPEQIENIIFPNVSGPQALAKKILEIDGRVKNPPNGNAWKEFRCYRNNQDMGSLWEVRQIWYLKTH